MWLWCARLAKSRALGAKMATSGVIRLTRGGVARRIEKASTEIRPGDEIAFLADDRLRAFAIRACAARRGPAIEAQALYEDRSPPPVARSARARPPLERDKGAGRPTKKDRRSIERLTRGAPDD